MAEGRLVNPLVQQFQKGGVPRDLRMLAAQGALPLKPADLVELLHVLRSDPEAEIAEAAQASLVACPAAELLPLLADREAPSGVVAWALEFRSERDLREAALQNTALADGDLERLVQGLPEHLAELVVINQVRLLRSPSLLAALEGNPSLSNDQRRRLRELRESFNLGGVPGQVAPPAAAEPPPPAPDVEPASPADTLEDIIFLSEAEAMARYLSEEERGEDEKVSVVQRIYRLNTAEKVITALKGSREERAVLVRDPNRIVAVAVLSGPRLTDPEIEAFAGMKSISDEILRKIGSHREWTKRYGVVANLVRNPRTPVGIALTLVPRLNARDMKSLTADRNVPEVVRKHAQRFVRQVADPSSRARS
jgi:hypothetical protein